MLKVKEGKKKNYTGSTMPPPHVLHINNSYTYIIFIYIFKGKPQTRKYLQDT